MELVSFFLIIGYYLIISLRSILSDSMTYDEILHLQSAREWLFNKTTPSDPFSPPLAKLPSLLPDLLGFNYLNDPNILWFRLTTVLVGILTLWLLYWWSSKLLNKKMAFVAGALLASEPLFLAHSHLVTTDVMSTLWLLLIVVSWERWHALKDPLWKLYFFLSLGLLAITKVTFLPVVGLWLILEIGHHWHQWRKLIWWPGWFGILGVIWAGYGFAWQSPISGWLPLPLGGFMDTFLSAACYVVCPKYVATRQLVYLGQVSGTGWLSYPLVALAIKLSLPLLLLFGWRIWSDITFKPYEKTILKFIASMLLIVTVGRYSAGVRHLLPLVPMMIVLALGLFATDVDRPLSKIGQIVVGGLLIYKIIVPLFTQDFIAYYQPLVGPKLGGWIMSDSNLDWGQNLIVLAQDKPEVDLVAHRSPLPLSNYGLLHAQPLPPLSKISAQLLKGKKVAISRTIWYQQQFVQSPLFYGKEPQLIANGTMYYFEF